MTRVKLREPTALTERQLRAYYPQPIIRSLLYKIAEPRNVRVTMMVVYLLMVIPGVGLMLDPPGIFTYPLALFSVYAFAGMILIGALLGAVSVLPGIWWLERVGLILLTSGIGIYLIVVISVGSSIIGQAAVAALALCFLARWMDIKGAQLAPGGV